MRFASLAFVVLAVLALGSSARTETVTLEPLSEGVVPLRVELQ
jgi:hypothetical protein